MYFWQFVDRNAVGLWLLAVILAVPVLNGIARIIRAFRK